MSLLTLYHGSEKIVSVPDPALSVTFNDFGAGFYLTEMREAAAQWACHLGESGFVNKYELETEGLKILDLNGPDCIIMNWLALLLKNRKFRLADAAFVRPVEYIIENFSLDISEYDVIRGNRGDEIYFFFAKAFLKGRLSYRQFKLLMNLGPMGEQVAVKSERAFENMSFSSLKGADAARFYPRRLSRNKDALANFYAETDIGDDEGIYIGDILRKEIKADDERLR